MSAIAAVIRFDGGDVRREAVERMTERMAYRGPDGSGHWIRGQAALGHCAMHATDAGGSPQPLHHEPSGVTAAMDGYLANWDDLRRDLEQHGTQLRCGDDIELVLHAYLTWGADCARHLDGEFACVIWDQRNGQALCVRDHHGLRPLFYHWDGRCLIVASEIAAVLTALPDRPPLNLGYLAEQAADVSFTSDQTIWTGVHRALPAHVMQWSANGFSKREYWSIPTRVETPFRSDGEYFEAYRAMFADCVRRSARSHLPVACEVSGGLDSSSVFAMAHHLSAQETLPAPEVRGYTLAGPPGTDADEITFARAVGRHLDTRLREQPLFFPDLDWFTDRADEDCDLPPFPNAAMSLHLDRAAAADGSRVTLTGLGGDQWLDGVYHYYRELFMARDWRRFAAQYRTDIAAMGLREATSLMLRLGPGSCLPIQIRHGVRDALGSAARPQGEAYPWLRREFQTELSDRKHRYEASMPAEYRDGYKLRKLKYPLWANILDQACRQRAYAGLEMRSPMMSRAFIEFSTTTPEHIRLRGNLGKYVHRHALTGLLPDEVTWRESKAEFSTVYHCHDSALHDRLAEGAQSLEMLCKRQEIAELIKQYMATEIDERHTGEIWGMYVTMIIMRLDAERREKGTDR